MKETKSSVIPILKTALKIESDGANYYRMASANTDNPAAKALFDFLTVEEQKHYDFFMTPLEEAEKGKAFNFSRALRQIEDSSAPAPEIFTNDFLKRLKGDHSSLSAVSIGITLELNSITFYREQKSLAQDESAKKFYDFLIKTEISHHELLTYWFRNCTN